jgi:xanthine dehydrogenase accessory factor
MLNRESVLERAAELKSRRVPFVLATVVRCEAPTSAKPGDKGIVDAQGRIAGWIGGGCTQPAVISVARKALADGQARLIRVSPGKGGRVEEGIQDFGMTCHSGGTVDIFLEPFALRPSLLIIGASPAALSLAGLAERTGYDVFVASAGAEAGAFENARQVLEGMDLSTLACARPDFVVVATQGKRDEAGLEAALGTGAGYIAFIASERKAVKLRSYLKECGHDPARVDAVVAPAGLAIGAVTPAEIALSVLAGIVREHRTALATEDRAAVEPARSAGTARDPVCGMSVEVESAEFRSEYQGTPFFFCCAGCQQRFEKAPESFLVRAEAAAVAVAAAATRG